MRHADECSQRTPEHALQSLHVDPADRTDSDVDTIFALVGQWPDFRKFVQGEGERREVCRRMRAEDYHKHRVIVRQGEDPDGCYLVFSGQCSIFQLSASTDESMHAQFSRGVLQALRAELGPDKCFSQLGVKGPTEEFGSEALHSNGARPWTVICDKHSILLHIDPNVYRATIAWFARTQLERRVMLLSQVKELQLLRLTREAFSRIAEGMEELRWDVGFVVDDTTFPVEDDGLGFIVVEEGVFAQHRVVSFGGDAREAGMRVSSSRDVKVADFGPRTMFPLPGIRDCVSFPFRMVVVQPVVAYLMRMRDLASMMLTTQTEKLVATMSEQPGEKEVRAMWMERRSALQWQSFRKSVVKEAREMLKTEKAVANGEFGLRRPGNPKPIKDHPPFTPIRDGRPIRIVAATQRRGDGQESIFPYRPRTACATLGNG
jgi:CRP-like cAMP-binding protein